METQAPRKERRAPGRFWGIRAKIFALAIFSVLLPTVLVGTSSYWTARAALTDKVSEQLNAKASIAASTILEWIQERRHDGQVFASSGLVAGSVERGEARGRATGSLVHDYLEEVLGRYGIYSGLLVLDERREIVTAAGFESEEDLARLLAGSPAEKTFFERHPEGARLWLETPILGEEGRIVGSLLLGSKLDSLYESIAASSPDDRLWLSSGENEPILLYPRESAPIASALDEVPAEGSIADYRDARGVRVLAAARRIATADLAKPLIVVAATDWNAAFGAVNTMGRRIVLLSALAALLSIALGYGLVVSLTGPLEKLTAGAHALSRGDYSLEIPVATRDEIGYLTQVFNQMTSALKKSHDSLEQLSVTDELTKLCNRRQFTKALGDEIARAERTGVGFAVILIDLDRFKSFNDRYGHLKGDELLERVGAYLLGVLEDGQLAARYGGEEFVMILPGYGIEEAAARAEWIRSGFAEAFAKEDGVTLSLGVAIWTRDGSSAAEIVDAADDALYRAKGAGRNRVMVADAANRGEGRASQADQASQGKKKSKRELAPTGGG